MATIYIRDVPAGVSEELKRQADAEGLSLSAYVGAVLERVAETPTNAQLVAELREPRAEGATTSQILDALQGERR